MKPSILLIVVLLLLFASCGESKKDSSKNDNLPETFEKTITEKYWKLKTLNGEEVKMEEKQEREAYFILKTDENKLKGFGGCNQFMGSYKLKENNQVEFFALAGTLKACPHLIFKEDEFLQVFELAKQYVLEQDNLTLKGKGGDILADFEAIYF